MTIDAFWRATPWELRQVLDAELDRRAEAHKALVSAAYYTATFGNARRLPPLDRLLRRIDAARAAPPSGRPLTREESLAAMQRLNAAYGGAVVHKAPPSVN